MTTTAQRLHEALARFEEALGGREPLVDALVAAPPDDSRDAFLGILADPRNTGRSLGALADELDLTAGEVLAFFRDAERAKAQILALHEVTSAIPGVTRDVMRRAENHFQLCPSCASRGKVWVKPRDKKGKLTGEPPVQMDCPACEGTGQILGEASLDHQKLALDMAGLVAKAGNAPLVQIDNSTQSLTIGALPFAQLQKAVQRVLDPPQLPAAPALLEATAVEVEP